MLHVSTYAVVSQTTDIYIWVCGFHSETDVQILNRHEPVNISYILPSGERYLAVSENLRDWLMALRNQNPDSVRLYRPHH
jgi:hypothetical protein